MKLHFISLEEFPSRQLAAALGENHQVSSVPDTIDDSYDGLLVGVDTLKSNKEIILANSLGVKVYSIPELICHLSQNKQRIVIAGTHGKAAVASCVVHVLQFVKKEVDYFIGKSLSGNSHSIKISEAPLIIIEGTAKQCSGFDPRPQFLPLNHHMTLITQLSHELKGQYSSFDEYVKQFDKLADATPKGGTVIYCDEDNLVIVIGGKEREDVKNIPYSSHPGVIEDGVTILEGASEKVSIKTSSDHDLQNIGGALALLKRLSVTEDQFYKAMKTYKLN